MRDDFIGIYDNLLTKEECSNFISYYNYLKQNGFTLDHSYEKHRADQEECNITHYDLNASNPIGPLFFEKTGEAVNQYLKKYSVLGQSDFLFYDLKLKHIPPAGGFHQWHYENTDVLTCTRQLVVQLYLNTIKEGGETEFLYLNKRVKAKVGRMIIFPAGYTHTHRGNPPIGEEKYIATTWGMVQSNS